MTRAHLSQAQTLEPPGIDNDRAAARLSLFVLSPVEKHRSRRRNKFRTVAMKLRAKFLTPIQNLALNLTFEVMDEEQINRTAQEYKDIAAQLPQLKILQFKINQRLKEMHTSDRERLYEICRFKAGDKRYTYEPLPTEISYETLRAALTISGMRPPRHQQRRVNLGER